MIDVESETLLTPRQALAHPALRNAQGRVGHLAKFYRLCDRGSVASDGKSRIRLEYVICPAGRKTSTEAIERFIERLNSPGGAAPASQTYTTKALRQKRKQADAALDLAGVR